LISIWKTENLTFIDVFICLIFNYSVLFLPQVLSFRIVRTLVCHSLDIKSVTKAILLEAL